MNTMYKAMGAAVAVALGTFSVAGDLMAADDELEDWQKAQKTEVWEPVPPKVTAEPGQPPSDATVLFDGTDLSAWESVKGGEAKWTVKDGVLTVKPGTGDIKTKQSFCDVQLHVEWRAPKPEANMEGQERNNSGVFLQQRYEIQVLDSHESKTYPNGQAASVYKQSIPLVNATRAPEQWQEYDILFTAPRFDGDELTSPAFVTVLHNGVVVQNHYELTGKTEWIGAPSYEAHGCAPIQLQDHSNEVSFRNIWVREIKPLK